MRNSIYHNLKLDRSFTASTGLTQCEFEELATDFCTFYHVAQNEFPEGFGNEVVFQDGRELLFMLLYYQKTNLTFDNISLSFGVARSTACDYIKIAKTILKLVLKKRNLLPKRYFKDENDIQEFFKDIPDLMIDAVERHIQRPDNQEEQENAYSVKKKFTAFKNTIITSYNKFIYFLSRTVLAGKIHDFNLFKIDFLQFSKAFINHRLWVDLGYAGIKDLWDALQIHIPIKKPRKSKANPKPELSPEQKKYNQFVGKNRVVVENAIAGMKRYNILVYKYRGKCMQFADDIIELCAGLWNFKVARRLKMEL
jgi:DDE superfamily endonuclease/Helix-turn-helix of DDE superfamily endonuclease